MPSAFTGKPFSLRPRSEFLTITMNLRSEFLSTHRQRYLPLLKQLEALFLAMDRSYAAVADQYGFQCHGCADNCCQTRFFHHTLLEYLYLVEGMRNLGSGIRQAVKQQALAVSTHMAEADNRGGAIRIMCPLNQDGQCRLYRYRPMICRLHGIPFELHRPDGNVIRNPGCDLFSNQCRASGKTEYIRFDRTPHYRRMAMLEQALRVETGYADKLKFSIARMLANLTDSAYEID
jgi:Fe-S-cluster containining protein